MKFNGSSLSIVVSSSPDLSSLSLLFSFKLSSTFSLLVETPSYWMFVSKLIFWLLSTLITSLFVVSSVALIVEILKMQNCKTNGNDWNYNFAPSFA